MKKITLFATLSALSIGVAMTFAKPPAEAPKSPPKPQASAQDRKLQIDLPSPTAASSNWIGVRMSPLPAALSAHIGDKGLMITNIVKGSPADQAGLEQYDVIRSFNGWEITSQQDLVTAVNRMKSGAGAPIGFVRGGTLQTRTITPAPRSDAGNWEYKYAEAEDALDNSVSLRGHTLQVDPNGNWVWRDLGPLQQLPDPLLRNWPDIRSFNWNTNDPLTDLDGSLNPQEWWLKLWEDQAGSSAQSHSQAEMQLSVNINGDSTAIQRKPNGSFHVEKKSRDGEESSADYADEDQFRQQDPDAYKIYRDSAATSGASGGPRSMKWRQDWQNQLREMIRQAEDVEKSARDRAARIKDMMNDMKQRPAADDEDADIDHEAKTPPPQTFDPTPTELTPTRNADGSITVVSKRGDTKITYEFKSEEEFKRTEPQLYESVKGALKK